MSETMNQSQEIQKMTGAQQLIAATMTEAELAKALGVPSSTVKRLRYDGKIPFVKVSRGRPIYLVSSIIAWLKEIESNAVTDHGKELTAVVENIAGDLLTSTITGLKTT